MPRGLRLQVGLSLLPAIVLFTVFFLLPLIVLVVTAFTRWSGLDLSFVGFHNFQTLLGDTAFWTAVHNTLLYCAFGVLVQVPLGVLIGVMLAQRLPGWRTLRAIIFIPYVISGAAYALIYSVFYNSRYGLLNRILEAVGLGGDHDWLYTSSTALPAVAATFVFVIGFNVVLVMADVASIPPELYEAARVDGATVLQRQRFLTLPLLRNTIGTLLLITLLADVALFDVVFILTSGGPANHTLTLTLYAYQAYVNSSWGYANAVGVVIILIGLTLIVGIRRLFRIGEASL